MKKRQRYWAVLVGSFTITTLCLLVYLKATAWYEPPPTPPALAQPEEVFGCRLRYFTDPRTELCFAACSTTYYGPWRPGGLTAVPCSAIERISHDR